MIKEELEASWEEQHVMVFELVSGTRPAMAAVSEADTGVLLEGERDKAPIVCPMVVVVPDNWI